MAGTGKGAEYGILIKSGRGAGAFAQGQHRGAGQDGHRYRGQTEGDRCFPGEGVTEEELLCVAASLEQPSEHPLAEAIVQEAALRNIPFPPAAGFEAVHGRGYGPRSRAEPFSPGTWP